MMLIAKKIDGIIYFISKVCLAFCGAILVFLTIMICAGVFNRFFLQYPWIFVEEWSALALIPMSYLAFGYTHRMNRHLKMDLIVKRLPIKWQNIMAIFAAVFSLICLVYMIGFAWEWFYYTFERSTVSSGPMKTPLWFFSLSILISMVLLTLDMFLFLVNRILYMVYNKAPLNFFNQIEDEMREEKSDIQRLC
jgi:TRAP-type C4-dicarboxylate transport system permease small subunit